MSRVLAPAEGGAGRTSAWVLLGIQSVALWTLSWSGAGLPAPALLLWAAAFAAYAGAATRAGSFTRGQIWAGGIVLRVGLFPLAPTLSEDIYRYMWDGWVQRHGVNPYLYPPGAPELGSIRTDWWSQINHSEVSTIYPPGAQLVFFVLAWIGPAWWIFKLAWLAADLGAAWLLERWLDGQDRVAFLLYLWSPLLVVEVAWSGHLDPLGIAPMLGAVLLAASATRRSWASGVWLGVGASIKFAPLAAIPVLWRRRGLAAAALAGLVPLAFYLPYAAAGQQLFAGLRTYADVWSFNAGAYHVLDLLPGPADLPKWLAAIIVVAVVATAVFRGWTLGRTLFWAIGGALLLSPTIHPWYLLWVLPFACVYRSRGWILFTGTVFLAYGGRGAYLATGVWPEPAWLSWAIHGPVLALLAWDGWRGRRS